MRHAGTSSMKRPTSETALWWLFSKETYVNQKRPACIKRDICNPKETYTTYVNQKKPSRSQRAARYATPERALWCCQKRRLSMKRDLWKSKENITFWKGCSIYATQEIVLWCDQRKSFCGVIKRDLYRNSSVLIVFKRDLCRSKETCVHQKRPSQFERAARYTPRRRKQMWVVIKRDTRQK